MAVPWAMIISMALEEMARKRNKGQGVTDQAESQEANARESAKDSGGGLGGMIEKIFTAFQGGGGRSPDVQPQQAQQPQQSLMGGGNTDFWKKYMGSGNSGGTWV